MCKVRYSDFRDCAHGKPHGASMERVPCAAYQLPVEVEVEGGGEEKEKEREWHCSAGIQYVLVTKYDTFGDDCPATDPDPDCDPNEPSNAVTEPEAEEEEVKWEDGMELCPGCRHLANKILELLGVCTKEDRRQLRAAAARGHKYSVCPHPLPRDLSSLVPHIVAEQSSYNFRWGLWRVLGWRYIKYPELGLVSDIYWVRCAMRDEMASWWQRNEGPRHTRQTLVETWVAIIETLFAWLCQVLEKRDGEGRLCFTPFKEEIEGKAVEEAREWWWSRLDKLTVLRIFTQWVLFNLGDGSFDDSSAQEFKIGLEKAIEPLIYKPDDYIPGSDWACANEAFSVHWSDWVEYHRANKSTNGAGDYDYRPEVARSGNIPMDTKDRESQQARLNHGYLLPKERPGTSQAYAAGSWFNVRET
ncbi:hypothetical protein F4808DRAFT_468122 [Astrocystis sublimbata]|nr:hypothetical protein F4808DRAFT_468122 [Astrocystis sublimbata]